MPGAGSKAKRGAAGVAEGEAAGFGPGSEKYELILDAAVAVIAENGYFQSPVSKIASRAGVADGTVYLYFKNKDEVLRAAIDRTVDRFFARVEEEFKRVKGPRERLETIGRLHLATQGVDRHIAVFMQTEMRQSAQFVAEFSQKHMARYIQLVREVVKQGQAEGVFRKELSDGLVAHVWFGAIDELLSSAVFTGRNYDAKVTSKRVMDMLLHGIGV